MILTALALHVAATPSFLPLDPPPSSVELASDLDAFTGALESHPGFLEVTLTDEWIAHDRQLRARLASDAESVSELQFVVALQRLLALFEDGHSSVAPSAALDQRLSRLPIAFARYAEGLFVSAADEEYAHLLGLRVTGLAGRPLADVEHAFDAITCGDNVYNRRQLQSFTFRYPALYHELGLFESASDGVEVEVVRDGEPERFVIEGRFGNARFIADDSRLRLPDDLQPPLGISSGDPHRFTLEEGDVLWIRHDVIGDGSDRPLAQFIDDVGSAIDEHDPAKVAIDLRYNGGGNNYLNQQLVHALVQRPEVSRRPGRLFVVTSARTFSAAMCLAAELERNTDAIFVGAPTGARVNHWGDATSFTLPATGTRMRVSQLHWQNSDPRDVRDAIHPDVAAPLSFEAWSQGHDPALEAIVAIDAEEAKGYVADEPNSNWYVRGRRR